MMIVSAALAMSFAASASATLINCNGASTTMNGTADCEPTPKPTYPTKKVPTRLRIIPEHTIYRTTEVEFGATESLGVNSRFLVFTGLSSGSPYGGFVVFGRTGMVDGRSSTSSAPVYLTSTRNTAGTTLWNGISQFYNTLANWTVAGTLLRFILMLF